MVRLVKGAYWDTEVKRAQERGLADYPVFTRKAMTDLCYAACTRRLLAARARLFPQFATHNALTVASVIEDAGGVDGYEFQRLHGMGEVLYETLRDEFPRAAVRVYAPVGGHRDLLAYLVRRLLENGANSSFVAVAADPSVPVEALLQASAELDRRRRAGAASEHPAAARSLWSGAAELRRRRVRPPGEPRCAAGGGARGADAPAATARRCRRRRPRTPRWRRRGAAFPGVAGDAGRRARRHARARRRSHARRGAAG